MSMLYGSVELGESYWVITEHASPPRMQRARVIGLSGRPGGGWANVQFAGVEGSNGNVFHDHDKDHAQHRLAEVRQEWMYRQVERMDTRLARIEKHLLELLEQTTS